MWPLQKNAPHPGGHDFQPTGIILKLVHIIGINLLTKFHEDWTINVASRVLTRKTAPPLCNIIETNLLTKFHEDWTINVVSGVLTRKMLTAHDRRRKTDKRQSQKLTMSALCSGELNIYYIIH
ncbi:hypothetical protein DPMN_079979 [Dreissena polymorpha]|uniref:Uncharacterized protein n=1 Tax=Dreissena polymorpha TaxID=45954 RepID=A0A9D3YT36_DREPO|nr:hypothetical protein DPMN_079979 [Dreissena polymorpha]